MSGSDPSTRNGPGLGPGPGPDGGFECPGRPFETVLGTPDPDVVADLSIGELLDVVAVEDPARGVAAFTLTGERVGAVTRDILRLRHCMEDEGSQYEAEVLQMMGGSVSVEVRPQQ